MNQVGASMALAAHESVGPVNVYYLDRAQNVRASARDALIVVMRAERMWCRVVPELADHSQVFRLNSAQNVTVSARNGPAGFGAITERLLAGPR